VNTHLAKTRPGTPQVSAAQRFLLACVLFAGGLLGGSGSAWAADAEPEAPPAPPPIAKHWLTIAFSPAQLRKPIFELDAEYAIDKNLSAGLMAGFGRYEEDVVGPTKLLSKQVIQEIQFGALAAYTFLGNFDNGVKVGVRGVAVSLKRESATRTGKGSSQNYGAFFGGKASAPFGLTGEVDLGYEVYFADSSETVGSNSGSEEQTTHGPLLNMLIGWSF